MKLLFCERCGDIVAPYQTERTPRFCACAQHALWWENAGAGVVRVHDIMQPNVGYVGVPKEPLGPQAYLLGLMNSVLTWPHALTAESFLIMLSRCPDSYLFKMQNSAIVRFRPGETSDSAWAPLPTWPPLPDQPV